MSEPNPKTEAELVEMVRAISVRAPEALHARVEALVAEHSGASARSADARRGAGTRAWPALSLRLTGAGAVALVAVLAIVLAVSGGGGSPGLSVRTASALTLLPATMPAPREDPRSRDQLASAVDGVAFPYWGERFGWRSSGARSDRVDGRTVTTVFYSNASGQRIGYAIVGGTPPPTLPAVGIQWRAHTPYRLSSEDGSRVVTWVRDGHLCIVAGRGVTGSTLLRLASWDERAPSA
jgi:hypothetical protein